MLPLDLIALKRKVGRADADTIALPLLIYFDAAKRGVCPDYGINFITKHLLCALYIGQYCKAKQLHEVAMKAYSHLYKSIHRTSDFVTFTTGEYKAMRDALACYLRVLPMIEVGQMDTANLTAMSMLGMEI